MEQNEQTNEKWTDSRTKWKKWTDKKQVVRFLSKMDRQKKKKVVDILTHRQRVEYMLPVSLVLHTIVT